ncbi:MAG: 23S rRNA (guanosine(2251)-2'-O)-methyltransferase RlmB [Kiritimatiellae bacterium]|nr:23S rRNA (guanosine(2251)-2'-O)-methyltransferase RlmB [Kiritimatiellia bacterium]MDD5520462.1 23S rRNA (guanosine(2251)-2'-O)-methyltransferase RlmB [Kiritimatiellia bacterium]
MTHGSNNPELIYGRHPVRVWLDSELPVKRILIATETQGQTLREIEEIAVKRGITVTRMTRTVLIKIVGHNMHQGVAAEVKMPAYVSIDDILKVAEKKNEPPLVCILDGIQDPQNFGAVIRTADGAGVHGIIVAKDRAVGLTPASFKASAGAAAHVPVAQVVNISRALEELKSKGLWITGAVEDAEVSYKKGDFKGPVGLVLGAEGIGIRRLVKEKCDFLVSVPMFGKINSLNVSVAAALLFYEARMQRI